VFKLVLICVVLLLFVLFYVLFVCKCVLYYCHRVKTQLQLINILYHIAYLFDVFVFIAGYVLSCYMISFSLIALLQNCNFIQVSSDNRCFDNKYDRLPCNYD